tara:strand:+ start:1377 stop:1502 length:126 start_codon:yes stop_codon:yes gene_type:complete
MIIFEFIPDHQIYEFKGDERSIEIILKSDHIISNIETVTTE